MPGPIVLPDEETRRLWEEARQRGWQAPTVGIPLPLDEIAPGDTVRAAWGTFVPEKPQMRSYVRVNVWGGLRPFSGWHVGYVLHGGGPPLNDPDHVPMHLEAARQDQLGPGGPWHIVPPSGGPGLYTVNPSGMRYAEYVAQSLRELYYLANAGGYRTRLLGTYGPRPDDWEYR